MACALLRGEVAMTASAAAAEAADDYVVILLAGGDGVYRVRAHKYIITI